MTKDDFRAYIAAFNAGDFDGFTRFYADDVVLRLGLKRTIHGRQGIVDFYAEVGGVCRERLTIEALVLDEEGVAAELATEFKALVDAPDFIAGPLVPGQSIFLTSFVHYRMADGRFTHIHSARANEAVAGPSTF
jgi:hypothetical protein